MNVPKTLSEFKTLKGLKLNRDESGDFASGGFFPKEKERIQEKLEHINRVRS